MSKVLKQLFREDFEDAERKSAHLRLVPPPAPPPNFFLIQNRPKAQARTPAGPTTRLKVLFTVFLLLSGAYFYLEFPHSPLSNQVFSAKKRRRPVQSPAVAETKTLTPQYKDADPNHEPDDFELNAEGVALFRAQKFKEASSVFNEILETSPDQPQVLVNLGMTQLKLKDRKAAKATLLKAMKGLNPQFQGNNGGVLAAVYNNLGSIALEERNWGQAIHYFERANQINPNYTEGRLNLAKAFEMAGRPVEAAKEYTAYLADPEVNGAVKPIIRKRLAKINTFLAYFEIQKESGDEEEVDSR